MGERGAVLCVTGSPGVNTHGEGQKQGMWIWDLRRPPRCSRETMMAQNRVLAVAVGRSRFYLLCSSALTCDIHLKTHPKIEIIKGKCSKIKMEDLLLCSNHSMEYLVHSPDTPHFREHWCRCRRGVCVECTKYRCKSIGHAQLHWSLLRRP